MSNSLKTKQSLIAAGAKRRRYNALSQPFAREFESTLSRLLTEVLETPVSAVFSDIRFATDKTDADVYTVFDTESGRFAFGADTGFSAFVAGTLLQSLSNSEEHAAVSRVDEILVAHFCAKACESFTGHKIEPEKSEFFSKKALLPFVFGQQDTVLSKITFKDDDQIMGTLEFFTPRTFYDDVNTQHALGSSETSKWRAKLQEHIIHVPLSLHIDLPALKYPASQIVNWNTGDTLSLASDSLSSAAAYVGNRKICSGKIGELSGHKAIRLSSGEPPATARLNYEPPSGAPSTAVREPHAYA